MICLYGKTETNFTDNGICVLDPTSCVVTEIAGGEYELHMEHPMDSKKKYLMLAEDMLIKAPVPERHIPSITLPETKIWITNKQTSLYSSIPTGTKPSGKDDELAKVRRNPSAYAWKSNVWYHKGALCTYNYRIWRAADTFYSNFSDAIPGRNANVWSFVELIASSNDVTNATPNASSSGTIIETLESGVQVYFIADYNATYVQVRSMAGNVGYVKRADVDSTESSESGITLPEKTITEQVFRIYNVECEDDTGVISVDARHISYAFAGNALYECNLKEATVQQALSRLQGSLMEQDDRKIYCNIVSDKKITQDWSFKNPINALLSPEIGLVPLMDAQLIRDNGTFYILDNSNPTKGITLAYGRNLTGVKWGRDVQDVITRIVPRCNNGKEGYLYLDQLFVDSPLISDYPYHKIEVLNCGYTVGNKYEKPDGTKETWTEESAKAQMLKDAQERYTRDKVDQVSVTLDVEFVLLGDTEEFKQYKGLQTVNLYDEITVLTGRSGMESTAQVTEYEYDCILKRYNSVKVGKINAFRRIPGYRVTGGSITYEKLSPDLVKLIQTGGESASDEDKPEFESNSGGIFNPVAAEVIDDLTHTDTDKALSANMGRELDEGKKDKQEPVSDPTASGTGVQFISSISQDENGVITPAKKTVRTMGGASASADGSTGLVPKPEAGEEEKFLRGDGEWASPAGTYSLPLAADGTRGGVQTGYAQNGRNYPVQLSGEKMFVNVPWTDNDHYAWDDITGKPETATRWPSWSEVTDKPTSFYTLPLAASGTRGGVKIGYTASGKNYPVQLDSNERMYVNVPWTDTNTWNPNAITGISRSGTTFTATRQDGTTFTFTQQDTNTTYSFSDNNPTLAWGTKSKVATVGGVDIHVTMPANPNTDHYAWGDITGKPETATRWPSWSEVTSKPNRAGSASDGGSANSAVILDRTTISNPNTSNTWIRLATITIPGTGLSAAGFTVIYSNRECLDNSSFILYLAIRRTTTSNVGVQFNYTPFGRGNPRAIYLRSNDGVTFYVYIQSVSGGWTTYYNLTKLASEGNVTFENAGLTSPITGTVVNEQASIGGYVYYATEAGNGIANITRSGTTFTATRANGTTFTFTQQDNNTWRGIQNNLTSSSTTDSLSAYQGNLLANGWARDGRIMRIALDPGDRLSYELANTNGVSIIVWRMGTSNVGGIKIGHGGNYINLAQVGTDYITIVQSGTSMAVVNGGTAYMRGFVIAQVNPDIAPGPM